jgi:N-acetylglucosamine-6-sulfatase
MLRGATFGSSRMRSRARSLRQAAAPLVLLIVMSLVAPPGELPRAQGQVIDRPSILLIVTDDQRADTLSALPSVVERIGRRGIRFGKGFVPQALCCPSRASILTGDYSHTTGVWGNGLAGGYSVFDESSTVATWLDAAGYRTGLFGKYLNHWADEDPTHVPPGWDEWFAFTENCCSYYGFTASVNGTPVQFSDDVYSTRESARRAAAFIRSAGTDPTFTVWAPDAPHAPATPEVRYEDAFSDLEVYRPPNYLEKDVSDKPAWVRSQPRWDLDQRAAVDALRRRMHETLLSVDDGTNLLIDALAGSGRLSNTLIVFTSDNGYLFGEHRFRNKPFPWRASHRVPFLVRYDPLIETPSTSQALVLSIDLAPTIADVTGVHAPPMDGRSLAPLLRQERSEVRSKAVMESSKAGPSPAYCGTRSRYSIFVRYATGEEEFYDYRRDRWELDNAIADPAVRQQVTTLRRFAREHCFPRPPGFSW